MDDRGAVNARLVAAVDAALRERGLTREALGRQTGWGRPRVQRLFGELKESPRDWKVFELIDAARVLELNPAELLVLAGLGYRPRSEIVPSLESSIAGETRLTAHNRTVLLAALAAMLANQP